MTDTRLVGFEAAAFRGADALDDDELAAQLAESIDRVATSTERVQDRREPAVVALVAARRLSR
jgi:hypothetical protein